jgi:SAM-dependent methyltransferase
MDLSRYNPTGRFTGLASLYQKCRPGYPEPAIDLIVAHCALGPASRLADIGCGTGIASRLFAARGIPVVGIEPNAEMRAEAEQLGAQPGWAVIDYREGQAEATGLADASVSAVLSAQAFHWFDADAALREFQRILRPAGWAALMWNERDESDPLTAAYGDLLRRHCDADRVEAPRLRSGAALLRCPLFQQATRHDLPSEQALDEEGLVGRAFSVSYAPRETDRGEALEAALRLLFRERQQMGQVLIRYQTSIYLGQKKD